MSRQYNKVEKRRRRERRIKRKREGLKAALATKRGKKS